MANLTGFQRLLHFAHPGLLAAAGGLLGVSGFLVAKYYHDALGTGVFNDSIRTYIAAAASISFKLLAFGLLFISVLDFSEGRKTVGKWGFLATIALNAYFLYESHCMAEVWTAGTGGYWHVLPLLAMLTLMVLFVEWRLAFSVGQAQESENQLAAAQAIVASLSEKLDIATGTLARLQSEKNASEAAQLAQAQAQEAEREQLAQLKAEQQERDRQQRESEMRAEILRLQRRIASGEKTGKPKDARTTPAEKILQTAVRLTRQNGGSFPGIGAVEAEAGYSEGNARKYFPNGSLQAQVARLLAETNQEAEFSEN